MDVVVRGAIQPHPPTTNKEIIMLTQKEFVRQAYDRYYKQGLQPGNKDHGAWERAHYPLPQPEGERWVWLLQEDHFIQGILQRQRVGNGGWRRNLLFRTIEMTKFQIGEFAYVKDFSYGSELADDTLPIEKAKVIGLTDKQVTFDIGYDTIKLKLRKAEKWDWCYYESIMIRPSI